MRKKEEKRKQISKTKLLISGQRQSQRISHGERNAQKKRGERKKGKKREEEEEK